METLVLFLRWAHVIGACVLLGTGAGIAFFMLLAHRTRDPAFIAKMADIVVLADFVFTASAVVLQPITGASLAALLGWKLTDAWLALSLCLYALTGALWLPVVWMQMRLRDLARASAQSGEALPPRYFRLFRLWLLCGAPAFLAVLTIIWLMLARPSFG
ncbi:MAG TPA: DUF2269 domain-containing protein [Caulobacterales bacterium]|nr:DUF2269 domain-containing protein [Caulobacterales bacterium]